MPFDIHRAPRHPFVAAIELTDIESEKHVGAHINNLSLFGCFVETPTPLPADTKVRVRMTHGGGVVVGMGRVVYCRPGSGMGIAFTGIEPNSLSILDGWLSSLKR